ncbi:hypothetical protein GCM10018772_05780 [Streptomyces fumanus]|uniref:Uncharacterized protein n=1 Tax=Streptomyces fumanus TaxID=67302 RepID=A0A919DVM7_9ACTN|nr:hypothetical protein GCM10018772_05780 [Streptomyces fumanus]
MFCEKLPCTSSSAMAGVAASPVTVKVSMDPATILFMSMVFTSWRMATPSGDDGSTMANRFFAWTFLPVFGCHPNTGFV